MPLNPVFSAKARLLFCTTSSNTSLQMMTGFNLFLLLIGKISIGLSHAMGVLFIMLFYFFRILFLPLFAKQSSLFPVRFVVPSLCCEIQFSIFIRHGYIVSGSDPKAISPSHQTRGDVLFAFPKVALSVGMGEREAQDV